MQITAPLLALLLMQPASASAARSSSRSATACPDSSKQETAQDCPWAAIARSWPASAGTPEGIRALRRSSPLLYRQIHGDSRHAGLKSLWGESTNFDELAKGQIVAPAILKALARIFVIPAGVHVDNDKVSFAGLEHTYGYLFSTLKTKFGYKRARWVSGQIERGFGLRAGLMGPNAPLSGGGTLFSNVTYFLGRIAFRDNEERLEVLDRDSEEVAPEVRNFNFESIKPVRLEEIIPSERLLIHTDLVPFLTDPTHELLVYSIVQKNTARLITGFPVTRAYADSLIHPDHGLGEDQPIVTRYNAYVEGISGKTYTGTRRVVHVDYVDWRKLHARARH